MKRDELGKDAPTRTAKQDPKFKGKDLTVQVPLLSDGIATDADF
jgi:hypothetical protein